MKTVTLDVPDHHPADATGYRLKLHLQAVLDAFGASLFFHDRHAAIWAKGNLIGVLSHIDGGTDLENYHDWEGCPDCEIEQGLRVNS